MCDRGDMAVTQNAKLFAAALDTGSEVVEPCRYPAAELEHHKLTKGGTIET